MVVGNILFHDTQFSLPQVSREKADKVTNTALDVCMHPVMATGKRLREQKQGYVDPQRVRQVHYAKTPGIHFFGPGGMYGSTGQCSAL